MFNSYYEAVNEKERLESLCDVEYKINTHMNNGLAFYTLVLLERKLDLPSEQYFTSVQTLEDYVYFKSTGMLWELEPLAPCSWEVHKQMCEWRKKNINVGEEGE